MKLKALLVMSALLAIALCGCNKESESGGSSNSTTQSTVNTPVYPVPDDATFLRGAAGDIIGLSEITAVWDLENQEISPESMTEENFFKAVTDSAYYALPLYPCLTNRDSGYDEDELLFKDAPQDSESTYIKVKKGDTVCGMTVSEASSEFDLNSPVLGVVVSTSLALEGEVTLSGYARVVPSDEYGVSVGDISFIPMGNVPLPVVRFDGCNAEGTIVRRTGDVYITNGTATDTITYTNEYTDRFSLGNINTTSADVSCLSDDGSFTKVNVTITNIKMTTSANWITLISADIVSITAAE